MRERIQNLSLFRKLMMILLAVMLLVFTVLYLISTAKKGFPYQNALLIPEEVSGGTRYSGAVQGEEVSFFVSADGTVEFRYGDKAYGPYVLKEDPSAVPENLKRNISIKGIELYSREKLVFRGGMWKISDSQIELYNEKGEPDIGISVMTPNGTVTPQNGTVSDGREPSAATIISLMEGPALTTKGSWLGWLSGTLLSVSTMFHIFFADDLFRWRLHLWARNTEGAEPSDWVVTMRAVGWVMITLVAVIAYVMGLRTIPPV